MRWHRWPTTTWQMEIQASHLTKCKCVSTLGAGRGRKMDQKSLKSLTFVKSETKMPKLTSLRQCVFSFQCKIEKSKDF